MLNIDSGAALQSVTSSQNPTPASVQFILRTKEISVDETGELHQEAAQEQDEGVITRIVNVFKELFTAVSGVFTQE